MSIVISTGTFGTGWFLFFLQAKASTINPRNKIILTFITFIRLNKDKMKTLFKFALLFLLAFSANSAVYAQKSKNPGSVAEAEKLLAKKNKKKAKETKKAMKEAKKNFAKMQTKEFKKSLKRNEKRIRKEARRKKRKNR